VASSIAILVFTWNTQSRLQKNNRLCFLSMALGAGLWLAMLALLFEPLVQRNTSLYDLLLYAILAGATPMAAFPAIYFFVGKRKRSR
jgi:hypothetical protein